MLALLGLITSSLSPLSAQSKIEFKEFTLDNGLNVILQKDNSTPIVAVSVLYHVGSKNEKPTRTGFAHFFEHLLFEGSDNIGRGEFAKKVESIGGVLNAFTSKDQTYYYEVVPSNHLETALYLESERMLHAKIDEIGLETQRSVVKEEKGQTQDNRPYGTIIKEIFNRTHQQHPYNWTIIGETEHLNAATLAEFYDFYRTYYVPNNAVLSIAGDLDYDKTEAAVRKYFSEIPRGKNEIVRPNIKEPVRTKEIKDIIYDNIQLPAIIEAYSIPPMNSEDQPALTILSTYLTGGKSSVLTKKLVDEQQKAMMVSAIPFNLEDGGVLIMFAIANMGVEASSIQAAIDEQIELVKKNGISDRDFKKILTQVETNLINNFASVQGIARNLAENKVYRGNANYINQELEDYQKVTPEDIKRVANKYLNKDSRVVLYYLPKSQKQSDQTTS